MRYESIGLAMVAALLGAATLGAQGHRPSLDVSLGGGAGFSQGRDARGILGLDAMFAIRPRSGSKALLALNGGLQSTLVHTVCDLGIPGGQAPLDYWSGCGPDFPGLTYVGMLAGLEWPASNASNGATLRLLGGSAYVRVRENGWTGVLGFPFRLDVATPHAGPLALIISVQALAVPGYRGGRLETAVARVGLRIR